MLYELFLTRSSYKQLEKRENLDYKLSIYIPFGFMGYYDQMKKWMCTIKPVHTESKLNVNVIQIQTMQLIM